MDRGAWWAAVLGVVKSRTWLSDFTFTFHFHALEKERATHSSVLAWRLPGTGEPGGLPSMGSHRVGHDWSDLKQQQQQQSEVKWCRLFRSFWTIARTSILTLKGFEQWICVNSLGFIRVILAVGFENRWQGLKERIRETYYKGRYSDMDRRGQWRGPRRQNLGEDRTQTGPDISQGYQNGQKPARRSQE